MADATCPNCLEPVVPGDQFCEACGVDLPADVATAERPEEAPRAEDPEAELLGRGTSTTRVAAATPCDCGGHFEGDWCNTCGQRRPDPRDHQEVDLDGLAAVASDKGKRYARNEDAFAAAATPDRVVAVVCDGVGSTVDPEVASAAAADAALAHLAAAPDDLVGAHRAADDAVRALDHTPKPDLGSPSCTFLAASVTPTDAGVQVRIGSLGDCRAYWIPAEGKAAVLTDDDSWAREQVRSGLMTWDEASADRRASVITRWLGRDADPSWEPTVVEHDLSGPGHLVVCSDGLWNYAKSPGDMVDAVAKAGEGPTSAALAAHLVEHALQSGGHDNITVVVVPVPIAAPTAPADPAAPTEEETEATS